MSGILRVLHLKNSGVDGVLKSEKFTILSIFLCNICNGWRAVE